MTQILEERQRVPGRKKVVTRGFSIRLDQAEVIARMALEEDRSESALVRRAIDVWLQWLREASR